MELLFAAHKKEIKAFTGSSSNINNNNNKLTSLQR
jgi:hypothetical protein